MPTPFRSQPRSGWSIQVLCAAICCVLASATARAQAPTETSFNINLFQPSPGPLNFFNVASPEIGDDMKLTIGLMASYQHRSFALLNCTAAGDCDDSSNTIDAVKHLLSFDLLASFNFLKYFQAGLAIPMAYMKGEGFVIATDPTTGQELNAAPGDKYSSFVVSDARVHLKARIIGKDGEDGPSFAVAVIPTLPLADWIGMGQSDDVTEEGAYGYGGDGFITLVAPKLLFGYRVGPFRSSVSAGALWRKKSKILSTEIGHTLVYGAALGYLIIPQIEIIAELFGNKILNSENFSDAEGTPLLFLGGARFLVKDFAFSLAGGGGILSGIGVPKFQAIGGITWSPQGKAKPEEDVSVINDWDLDNDGIHNDADKCPNQPEDTDEFEDEDGCPEADNDGDGIVDGYDSCPLKAEDKDKFRDDDGCPDLDHDEDGIEESKDKCPDQAEDFDDFEDEDGCPEADNDKDGLADGEDFCVSEPEDKDGFEDEDGCPDFDNDFDGVPDVKDKCPNEAETLNGIRDEDGCPDRGKALVIVTEERIDLKEMIMFKTGSDQIRGRQSFDILDIITSILLGNTKIRVSIEGHTDNRGNAAQNRDLSKRRSEAVKRYLVGKGVEDSRLETIGWGPDRPIESNRNRKGRAANRRVEFIIIRQQKQTAETDSGPAPAEPESPGEMDFTASDSGSSEMNFTTEEKQGEKPKEAEMSFEAE
ncbi:MAG: OmpA family protein [Myxococcota bacterium]|nr:OmpA family protein [Myxococcota bacterium]